MKTVRRRRDHVNLSPSEDDRVFRGGGKLLALAGVSVIMVSCAGFDPAPGSKEGVYRPPEDHQTCAFRGMSNERQMRHLLTAEFPRLTDGERAAIRAVNRRINREISYLDDQSNYGVPDFPSSNPGFRRPPVWGMPLGRYGDCEDYALTKKEDLVRGGVDPSRLFVITVRTGDRWETRPHAVLVVPEGGEWWVLDNADNRIEPASYLERYWGWKFPGRGGGAGVADRGGRKIKRGVRTGDERTGSAEPAKAAREVFL